MSIETWLPIPGYPGYEISDLGRVRSSRSRWGTAPPHLLTAHLNSGGYLQVHLYLAGKRRSHRVHVLVALAFRGPCPEGLETRHIDGVKLNVALTNLIYGTRSENNLDTVRHGTHNLASKTQCLNGHPFDEENTYLAPDGHRQCRACAREATRRYRQRMAVSS